MRAIGGLAYLFIALAAGSSAAWAGPPFRTDDPEPVEYRRWEFNGFSQSTHVRGDTSGALPGVEVNYGAVPDVQLHILAQAGFDKPSSGAWRSGFGDTEFGVKYRFVQEDPAGWRPMVAIFPAIDLPTGDADRHLGTGHTHAFLPLWVQKSFGAWTTYGGGGYWINPGEGNKNYWFAGWEVQRKLTGQLTLGGEIFHQTANVVGGRDSTGFNLGGIYDVTDNHHLLLSAGRGLQNATETNEFTYYVAYQFTF
jgi:hypothetical protein